MAFRLPAVRARHSWWVFVVILATSAFAHAADFSVRFEEIKKSATKKELYQFLFALPKGGDLHNHLGGACPPDWWYAIATNPKVVGDNSFYTRVRIGDCNLSDDASLILYRTIRKSTWDKLPECEKSEYEPLAGLNSEDIQKWKDSLRLDKSREGRDEFFNVIWFRINEMFDDPHVMAEVIAENVKQFGAEGLRYLETQYSADGYTDSAGTPISEDAVVQIVRERIAQDDVKKSGVTIRFQKTILRFLPDSEKRLENAYAFVSAHRDLWVAVNMAGREDNDRGYPLRFLNTFREMRKKYSGIGLSIHAGEVDEPNSHVRDTLLLGATRIGHGLNLITDPETMLLMQDGRYLVEINLISNRLLEYFPDLTKHPFPEFLRTGIPVCLNTDDRGMWDSNMTDEYFTGVTTFNLTWSEIVQMGRNSLKYAFVEEPVKRELLKSYEEAVAAFETKFGDENWREQLKPVKPIVSNYAEKTLGITK
ncbi:MAG TPA: hypothetical protein VIT91_05065 [Chthoniobacterales bacterium]